MINPDKPPTICVDKRELRSAVAIHLEAMGADVRYKVLTVGDYVCSNHIIVERKQATEESNDFIQSLFGDHKIWTQLFDTKYAGYTRPILIVEGAGAWGAELYEIESIKPGTLLSTLCTIATGYGIPTIYTVNAKETAQALFLMADRAQNREHRPIQLHGSRSGFTPKMEKIYTVSSIANVGRSKTEALLEHFGTVESVFTATEDELRKVPGIGKKIAKKIRSVLGDDYK